MVARARAGRAALLAGDEPSLVAADPGAGLGASGAGTGRVVRGAGLGTGPARLERGAVLGLARSGRGGGSGVEVDRRSAGEHLQPLLCGCGSSSTDEPSGGRRGRAAEVLSVGGVALTGAVKGRYRRRCCGNCTDGRAITDGWAGTALGRRGVGKIFCRTPRHAVQSSSTEVGKIRVGPGCGRYLDLL